MPLITHPDELSESEQRNAQRILGGDTELFQYLPNDHRLYRYVPVLEHLLVHNPNMLQYVGNEVMAQPEWTQRILNLHPHKLLSMDPKAVNNHEQLVEQTVNQNPWMLTMLPEPWRTPQVLRSALEGGRALLDGTGWYGMTFTEQLRCIVDSAPASFWDRETAHLCARLAPNATHLLPKAYAQDPYVISGAIKTYPNLYKKLDFALKNDPLCAQEALMSNGDLLEHAPPNIRTSVEHVRTAITNSPGAYRFADYSVRLMPQIVELAASGCTSGNSWYEVLESVPQALRSDSQWVQSMLFRTDLCNISPSQWSTLIKGAAWDDEQLVRRLVHVDWIEGLKSVHEQRPNGVWEYTDLAAKLVSQHPDCISDAPTHLRNRTFLEQVLRTAPLHPLCHWRTLYEQVQHFMPVDEALSAQFVRSDPSVFPLLPVAQRSEQQVLQALIQSTQRRFQATLPALTHSLMEQASSLEPDVRTALADKVLSLPVEYRKFGVAYEDSALRIRAPLLRALMHDPTFEALTHNPEQAHAWTQRYPALYPMLAPELQDVPELFCKYLQLPELLPQVVSVPKVFASDAQVAQDAIKRYPDFYVQFDAQVQAQPEIARLFIQKGGDPAHLEASLRSDLSFLMSVCAQRGDDRALRVAHSALKGQITRTQRQLEAQRSDPVSVQEAAQYLISKRGAQAEKSTLKKAVQSVAPTSKRTAAHKPMGRAL